MAWTLSVWDPDGSNARAITNATRPNPIMSDIEAVVDAGGRTNSINFRALQEIALIPPRAIIQYTRSVIDGPLAAGVVVTSPPLTSPGSGPADRDADAIDRITAVGLEQLARDSIIGPRLFQTETDVAEIAYRLCDSYAHPALFIVEANFPPTGHSLSVYYSPEKTLADALDELAATIPGGARWYVSAYRELIFTTT